MTFLDDYEPVEDRVREFWSDHPEGRIVTYLVAHGDGDYIFRAEVYRLPPVQGASMTGGVQFPDATGYAHDSASQLPSNMKASALEVCETSAIGRALANLGYAAKGKRPSREEMQKSAASGGSSEEAGAAATEPEEADLSPGGRTSDGPSGSVNPQGLIDPSCKHALKKTPAGGLFECSKCKGVGKLSEFKNVEEAVA